MVAGVLACACYGYISISIYHRLDFQNLQTGDVLLFALFWPMCLIVFLGGVLIIAWAIIDWHGNAERKLLLKLLDAQLQSNHKHDA
jgi:hypothetical protein